ncbi:YsnF/AvaK domain-containing protein, partial [Phenylobacterium sp.]|uniref:YsnF/AvaK domain-containing protein n=1 Tax=Phenylobacterium sp. TaxID=1871053 RepID=UPI002E32EBF7
LTAKVRDDNTDEAIRVLESSGAIDLDQREQEWRAAGWSGGADLSADTGAAAYNDGSQTQSSGFTGQAQRTETLQAGEEVRVPITEEQLRVGKREVERGGVRVRSYVVETPVHEQVGLREEHVSIERHPVNQTVGRGSADELFEERSFEVTERAEEAVVDKQAIVREELTVRKDVEEHVENIDDTVRHTEVDVQDERSARRAGANDDLGSRRDF